MDPAAGSAAGRVGMRAALDVYGRLMRQSLAAQLQYGWDFALGLGVAVLTSGAEIVVFSVILSHFRSIGGWGLWQIALLYGMTMGSYALHRLGAGDLHSFSQYIQAGTFDQLLLRPWSPLLALILRSGRVGQIGNAIVPLAVAATAFGRLRAAGELVAGAGIALGGVLVCAVVLQFALAIGTYAAAFWVVQADELSVLTINAPNTAGEYPLAVYPAWLRGYLFSVAPVGLVTYLPLRFLLGRGGPWWSLAVAPLAAAAALAIALWLWRRGETRYLSTGS